jgi:hypothetical protein
MAAIYMWFEDEEVIVTTTPYPIEIIEGMHMGAELLSIRMDPIPEDAYAITMLALSGDVKDILITAPIEDDAYQIDVTALTGDVKDILIIAPPEDDAYETDMLALTGEVRDAIVAAWMPDEGLHFGCTLLSISMTAV